MPKIVEFKAAEAGFMWVKIEIPGPQGSLSILSQQEINHIKKVARCAVLDEITEKIKRDIPL